MPEAPDVEVFTRYLDATALHKEIRETTIHDERLLHETDAESLTTILRGESMESAERVGKYLFARLSGGKSLLLHFGMTGYLSYFKHRGDTPEYAQVVLDLENGYHLAYVNKRILGRVGIVDDVQSYLDEHDIGPDAVRLSEDALARIIGRGRGAVKTTLMNQRMLSGLGNVYSDEVLFQSGVHPKSIGARIPREAVHAMYRQIHAVFDAATEAKADPEQMPDRFLVRHREAGARFQGCPGGVQKEQVSGRSCYYCPGAQREFQ